MANQNGIAVPAVDFKSLQNGSSKKIAEWQAKLSQAGAFAISPPQTQQQSSQQQIQSAQEKPLSLKERANQILANTTKEQPLAPERRDITLAGIAKIEVAKPSNQRIATRHNISPQQSKDTTSWFSRAEQPAQERIDNIPAWRFQSPLDRVVARREEQVQLKQEKQQRQEEEEQQNNNENTTQAEEPTISAQEQIQPQVQPQNDTVQETPQQETQQSNIQTQATEPTKSNAHYGNTTEVITGSRTPHQVQYRVVEANELNPSHVIDNGGVFANKSYPAELQPRNR